MKAKYNPDGVIAVSGDVHIVNFTKIWAGIGWPEREQGYLCVVGERDDGRWHAISEKRGGLWELGDAALQAKDELLVERIIVDTGDELSTSYLRTRRGLCFYDEVARESQIPAGALPSRSYAEPAGLATVSPVSKKVADNYRSALEKTREVILKGRLLIYQANCPILVYTLRQPLEDLMKSPVMKGLVWVVTALETAKGNGDFGGEELNQWYGNPTIE